MDLSGIALNETDGQVFLSVELVPDRAPVDSVTLLGWLVEQGYGDCLIHTEAVDQAALDISGNKKPFVMLVAQRCDAGALSGLEALAETLGDTALPPYEQDLGHAALAAMAHIDAGRARAFLRRSEANPAAVAAVERAARGGCSGAVSR